MPGEPGVSCIVVAGGMAGDTSRSADYDDALT